MTAKNKERYEDLPLMPSVVAQEVLQTPYAMQEVADALRSAYEIGKIEPKRQALTKEQQDRFVYLADTRCRAAYNVGAKWFLRCVAYSKRTNRGRDELYTWLRHWMAAWLTNPEVYESMTPNLEERAYVRA